MSRVFIDRTVTGLLAGEATMKRGILSHMSVTTASVTVWSYFGVTFICLFFQQYFQKSCDCNIGDVVHFDDMTSLNSISRPFDFLATLTFTSILRQY